MSRKVYFATLIVILSSVILFGKTAFASSIYDSTITTTNDLRLTSSYNSCQDQEHQTDWSSVLNDESYWSELPGSSFYTEAHQAFQTGLSNTTGWAVTQITNLGNPISMGALNFSTGDKAILISFTADSQNSVDFASGTAGRTYAYLHSQSATPVYNIIVGLNENCDMKVASVHFIPGNSSWSTFDQNGIIITLHGSPPYSYDLFFVNAPINYPSGYTGEQVGLTPPPDTDGDGLNTSQETEQGTSDQVEDSDEDGLDDFTESIWNPNRQPVFCGTECAYPDPTAKDLYVEVDWMNDGTNDYKPTSTQLSLVEDAFDNKGINLHVDTGQFGGGNELPTYTQDLSFYRTPSATDFYDYKYGNSAISANFNSDRYHIWHYLISGYGYTQDSDSSGASYVGDDDTFISTGLIKDDPGAFPHVADTDHAIAGTILHELGHSMCLSSQQEYTSQPSGCTYAGIHTLDDLTYNSYHSVMNYTYQMTNSVSLSTGFTSPEDHDDWAAITEGMGDFAQSDAEGEDPNSQFMQPNFRTSTPQIRHITQ